MGELFEFMSAIIENFTLDYFRSSKTYKKKRQLGELKFASCARSREGLDY